MDELYEEEFVLGVLVPLLSSASAVAPVSFSSFPLFHLHILFILGLLRCSGEVSQFLQHFCGDFRIPYLIIVWNFVSHFSLARSRLQTSKHWVGVGGRIDGRVPYAYALCAMILLFLGI